MEEKAKPVETMLEKSEKPLEEELSWEKKWEKFAEEIEVENETEPGNLDICFTPKVTITYLSTLFSRHQ